MLVGLAPTFQSPSITSDIQMENSLGLASAYLFQDSLVPFKYMFVTNILLLKIY